MRSFFVALFFTGILLVVLNSLLSLRNAPPRIEYRYLPRDLDTYLRDQPLATVQFESMFKAQDVAIQHPGQPA